MSLIRRFLAWLRSLFAKKETPTSAPTASSRTIVPILIYPQGIEAVPAGEEVQIGNDIYFLSAPVEVPIDDVEDALKPAGTWLNDVLGATIPWAPLRRIASSRSLDEWRAQGIRLVEQEVRDAALPWTEDNVYLAFVRGMGGFAGGIKYEPGKSGYSMVGDICLEAVCRYPEPNAATTLLSSAVWPDSARSALGQTAAFIHEALHGLDLPHPDGWPEEDQPQRSETIMGDWWNMPDFSPTKGLTDREIQRVLKWLQ
ncbi:MAG: hypothetical protein ACE5JL_10815 [Dehalococcoidia bacterium]